MKRNGFACPYNLYQISVWLLYLTRIAFFFIFFVPLIEIESSNSTKVVFEIIFIIFYLLSILFMIITTYIDPSDPFLKMEQEKIENCLKNNKKYVLEINKNYEFCVICCSNVKSSSKHCKTCNRCTDNFDHHCTWLNNCIGKDNYMCFIIYLVINLISSLYILILSLIYCIKVLKISEEDLNIIIEKLGISYDVNLYCIISLILNGLDFMIVFNMCYLISTHIWLFKKGLTTYEYIIKQEDQKNSSSSIVPEKSNLNNLDSSNNNSNNNSSKQKYDEPSIAITNNNANKMYGNDARFNNNFLTATDVKKKSSINMFRKSTNDKASKAYIGDYNNFNLSDKNRNRELIIMRDNKNVKVTNKGVNYNTSLNNNISLEDDFSNQNIMKYELEKQDKPNKGRNKVNPVYLLNKISPDLFTEVKDKIIINDLNFVDNIFKPITDQIYKNTNSNVKTNKQTEKTFNISSLATNLKNGSYLYGDTDKPTLLAMSRRTGLSNQDKMLSKLGSSNTITYDPNRYSPRNRNHFLSEVKEYNSSSKIINYNQNQNNEKPINTNLALSNLDVSIKKSTNNVSYFNEKSNREKNNIGNLLSSNKANESRLSYFYGKTIKTKNDSDHEDIILKSNRKRMVSLNNSFSESNKDEDDYRKNSYVNNHKETSNVQKTNDFSHNTHNKNSLSISQSNSNNHENKYQKKHESEGASVSPDIKLKSYSNVKLPTNNDIAIIVFSPKNNKSSKYLNNQSYFGTSEKSIIKKDDLSISHNKSSNLDVLYKHSDASKLKVNKSCSSASKNKKSITHSENSSLSNNIHYSNYKEENEDSKNYEVIHLDLVNNGNRSNSISVKKESSFNANICNKIINISDNSEKSSVKDDKI